MANRWGIPKETEVIVINRDLNCVYCGTSFVIVKRTWEHIINDIKINDPENIALCCSSCNASKGNKNLTEWLKSKYCETKGISKDSVAKIVQNHLK